MKKMLIMVSIAMFAVSLVAAEPSAAPAPAKKAPAKSSTTEEFDPAAAVMGKVIEVDLTDADVQKFIKAFPELYKDKELKSMIDSNSNPMEVVAAAGANYAKYDEFAKKKGYAGFTELLSSTGAIISAYSYLKMQETQEILEQKLKEMPAEMQPAFKVQIDKAKKEIKKYSEHVTPATMESVKKNYASINTMIEGLSMESIKKGTGAGQKKQKIAPAKKSSDQ